MLYCWDYYLNLLNAKIDNEFITNWSISYSIIIIIIFIYLFIYPFYYYHSNFCDKFSAVDLIIIMRSDNDTRSSLCYNFRGK